MRALPETRLPSQEWADMQVQQALDVLSRHWAEAWEDGRAEREAATLQRIDDWLTYEAGCNARGAEYARQASKFPAAHKDHAHYLRLADHQFTEAARARRRIEVERAAL